MRYDDTFAFPFFLKSFSASNLQIWLDCFQEGEGRSVYTSVTISDSVTRAMIFPTVVKITVIRENTYIFINSVNWFKMGLMRT